MKCENMKGKVIFINRIEKDDQKKQQKDGKMILVCQSHHLFNTENGHYTYILFFTLYFMYTYLKASLCHCTLAFAKFV